MNYIKSNINKSNNTNNNVSFKGLKGELDNNLKPIYRFSVPPHNPNTEDVELEIAIPDYNNKTDTFKPVDLDGYVMKPRPFNGNSYIDIAQDEIKELTDGFAYRYRIVDKKTKKLIRYTTDEFKTISIKGKKNNRMNFIEIGTDYGVTPKTGTILDVFKDSGAILKDGKVIEEDLNFCRNNFNKLGGSIEGLLYLLKNTNELAPYRYIKTTPDAGVDEMSSHGYWPENYYQCTNKDVMDDFTFNLFIRGKGYIADGAYTSLSFQSPFVQHALKYGPDSPYYNMIKLDKKSGYACLGLLPEGKENEKHVGVRLVNGKNDPKYDKSKPTYIQLYDQRLVKENGQLEDSTKLIKTYDKDPEDIYDVTSERYSVRPAYFEIDPNDPKAKLFGEKNHMLLDETDREKMLSFPFFKIVTRTKASGAVYWDGNTDMIKLNITNPDCNEKDRQGSKDAKDFIMGAVQYWTRTTRSNLIYRTAAAKNKEESRKTIAYQNGISQEEYNALEVSGDKMHSLIVQKDNAHNVIQKPIKEYIKEFPLQTIETSPELIAIMSSKEFKNMLLDEKTLDKMSSMIEEAINNSISSDKDAEYKAYFTEVTVEAFIKALISGAIVNLKEDGSINPDELKQTSSKSLIDHSVTPINTCQDEERLVAKAIKSRLNAKALEPVKQKVMYDLQNTTLKDFRMAEALVQKGKGGLNWRFDAAKDIADLDEVRSTDTTFDKQWNGSGNTESAFSFWKDVVGSIKKINPASYIICEVTSLWDFYDQNGENSAKLPENFAEKYSKDKNNTRGLPDLLETLTIERSNSTTSSNYAQGFNHFSFFVGVDPEHGDADSENGWYGNVSAIKSTMDNYNKDAAPNTALLVHNFFENYDKPRILHIMPLDSMLFHADGKGNHKTLEELVNMSDEDKSKKNKRGQDYKKIIEKATGGRNDYSHISPKAVAVSTALRRVIDKYQKEGKYTDEQHKKLLLTLQMLTNGQKNEDSNFSYKRAEKFGAMSYEVSIKDLYKRAGIELSQEELDEFCWDLLGNSIKKQERLWQIINSMSGANAVYDGMQFGQTGYESASKNLYQSDRNQALRYRKNAKNFKDVYDKLFAINALYLEKGMSALKDGTPVSCDVQSDGAIDIWPIVKTDEKGSTVLTLATNFGIKQNISSRANQETKIDSVEIIKKENNVNNTDTNDYAIPMYPLENNTVLKRKIYDETSKRYVDEENTEYKIEDGELVRYENGQKTPIVIDDTTLQFYVPDKKLLNEPKPKYTFSIYPTVK